MPMTSAWGLSDGTAQSFSFYRSIIHACSVQNLVQKFPKKFPKNEKAL